MRIALCLSGMPRTVIQGHAHLKQILLDKYNVDVFIHTWQEEAYKPKTWAEKPEYIPPNSSESIRYNNITYALMLYKPISFQIDKFHVYQEYYRQENKFKLFYRYCSMLESIYISNKLKIKYENDCNFKYDCVIRCRFDVGFESYIPFEIFDLSQNIYVKNIEWWDISTQINDWFAFSSSKNMDTWCDMYNHMQEIRDAIVDTNFTDIYRKLNQGPDPHVLYATYVRLRNLSIIGLPINWHRLEEEKRAYD